MNKYLNPFQPNGMSHSYQLDQSNSILKVVGWYNAFNVYRREFAPGTVSLTGDRAQGDDSKHWAYSIYHFYSNVNRTSCKQTVVGSALFA